MDGTERYKSRLVLIHPVRQARYPGVLLHRLTSFPHSIQAVERTVSMAISPKMLMVIQKVHAAEVEHFAALRTRR